MTVPAAGRIDVHHHFVPPEYVAALAESGYGSIGGTPFPAWDEESMSARMDDLGIGRAMLSVSAPGVVPIAPERRAAVAAAVNDAGVSIRSRSPERVGVLATLPLPDVDAALAEIERCSSDLAVEGFVLLTNADGLYLADPLMEPIWAELDRRRSVVFVHPALPPAGGAAPQGSLPPAVLEFTFDTTRAVADLIVRGIPDRYPQVKVVLAHLGGTLPFLAGRLELLEHSPREVYREFQQRGRSITDYLRWFWFDTAMTTSPSALAAALQLVGAERLVFGSDTPFGPPTFVDRCVDQLVGSSLLNAEELRLIEVENAERLFSL